ncbi:ferritin-like domain-containing protein [Nocardia crassostreae]|uniref:ferritin-like domain-containing protein n=1 Tax=Nocardia crassostreae TaxID=53428 RepID=UPI00082FF6C3|nr:ferritin-like domain-containing protein [Nocardia crassostreae]
MSVLETPRVHFSGVAVTRLPTGPRSGLLDLATNRALTDDGPFPLDRPSGEYAEFLRRRGERFDPSGEISPDGMFGTTTGWNFGGNGHFWIDASVTGCERAAGLVDTSDALVGRQIDFWGHYCEYTAGTANRSRVFDVDPASNWTTTVMVGQLALGRHGRSHEVGYLVTGDVEGCCPPRWQDFAHIRDVGDHPLAHWFRRSVVYQFTVRGDEDLHWLAGAGESPTLAALRGLVDSGGADGLVVQFALTNMATPTANDEPDRWDVRGTVGPWRAHELRTYPAGRLLTAPQGRTGGAANPLHTLSVRVGDTEVTANLITAVRAEHRAAQRGPGPTHRLDPAADLGDLELRTANGTLVAVIPGSAYEGCALDQTSGIVTVPRLDDGRGNPGAALHISAGGRVLLEEIETVVQSDEACLFLEHPNSRTGEDFAAEIPVRCYVRGEPARVREIRVRQFFNPRALPLDPAAQNPAARPEDIAVLAFRGSGDAEYAAECTVGTDERGRGVVAVKGLRGGAARVLLQPGGAPPPHASTAAAAYDNDDELGYWSAAGGLAVRVLPDCWRLDELADDEVTFDVLYREVFAYYELLYSFMRAEVFSLADEFKVQPYARLIWHVSDARHRDRTFYMPSTRDLAAPQIRLLLRYLESDEAKRQTPPALTARRREAGVITTREELLRALYQALTVELAVMIQYLYAAYSLPTQGAAKQYVAQGEWNAGQLNLACGSGAATLTNGWRGALLNVAREEMMHFLAINNILMAMGRPFHVPRLDFGALNGQVCVPLEFSLEPFGLAAVQRFAALEQPHDLLPDLADDPGVPDAAHAYGSLSELYAAIRAGIQRVPGALVARKGRSGGTHHLFMRESVNAVHPDYQLAVDDVESAVFAIDFVTEHGEGGKIASVLPAEESHFDTFLRISDALITERTKDPAGRRIPWNPAYPVLRNPTLRAGDAAKDLVTHPPARLAMTVFNRSYQLAMQLMVQHFGYCPDSNLRRSRLMNWALDLMVAVLRPVGELIVTLPSGRPGRTAGPSFELEGELLYIPRPDVAMECLARDAEQIAGLARQCTGLTPAVADLLAFLAGQFRAVGTDIS